jgi:hypothetical protein
MSYPFNPSQGLIIVDAVVEGPSGTVTLHLALDTGASKTLISPALLLAVGLDPALAPQRVQITTGSGVEFVPILPVARLESLGQVKFAMPVLAHTLPPSANVDGLLGVDFFRGFKLDIDFRQGQITLS